MPRQKHKEAIRPELVWGPPQPSEPTLNLVRLSAVNRKLNVPRTSRVEIFMRLYFYGDLHLSKRVPAGEILTFYICVYTRERKTRCVRVVAMTPAIKPIVGYMLGLGMAQNHNNVKHLYPFRSRSTQYIGRSCTSKRAGSTNHSILEIRFQRLFICWSDRQTHLCSHGPAAAAEWMIAPNSVIKLSLVRVWTSEPASFRVLQVSS
jgi:hypothetical protein